MSRSKARSSQGIVRHTKDLDMPTKQNVTIGQTYKCEDIIKRINRTLKFAKTDKGNSSPKGIVNYMDKKSRMAPLSMTFLTSDSASELNNLGKIYEEDELIHNKAYQKNQKPKKKRRRTFSKSTREFTEGYKSVNQFYTHNNQHQYPLTYFNQPAQNTQQVFKLIFDIKNRNNHNKTPSNSNNQTFVHIRPQSRGIKRPEYRTRSTDYY
jgi:hypothetical protein